MFEAQPQRQSLVSYFKNLWNSTQAAIILAGFCILALFLTILYQINCDQTDWICRGVSIFLIVVLAQNIIAAICAPLLIKHKKILNY